MPRGKESLYKDRIFGDDETPPRLAALKPSTIIEEEDGDPYWFENTTKATNTTNPPTSTNTTSPENEIYPFSHDIVASTRLHLQHTLWHTSTGYLLHPSIPTAKPGLRIADVGAGTGVWSVSILPTLPPSTKISAFDISLAQTPPAAWCPENLKYHQLDVLKDIPRELEGIFDIVHTRLLLCIFQSGDPMPLLRNLMKLLKLGGYLQWQEYNPPSDRILTTGTPAPKLQAFRDAFNTQTSQYAWISSMHSKFGEAGGELIAHEKHWTAPEMRMLKQEITFLAVKEWCGKLRKEGQGEMVEKYERLMEEAEQECWESGRGTVVDSEMVTWVVRKM